jgi:hypothetical protein
VAYGNDITTYVEDKAGDLGAPGSPAPWWLSPDVDIPAHSGLATQGSNQVQIRVHTHEEPFTEDKIVAEVYVGTPGFVLSPTTGTKRIDPGNLKFRPANVPGTEPVADVTGGTLTFPWTPSAAPADLDGPGHRCLIVRAFAETVTPPTGPFDVPNEQHEAQHNLEVLTTTMDRAPMDSGGWGTPWDPRHREDATGLWWEVFATMAAKRRGKHFVVWAFDPEPDKKSLGGLKGTKIRGFSDQPPDSVTLEPVKGGGRAIDPRDLDPEFAERAGIGTGLFRSDRLLAAAELELDTRHVSRLVMRFDLSNLKEHSAVVLHGVQWDGAGRPEGGMTVVALAPTP